MCLGDWDRLDWGLGMIRYGGFEKIVVSLHCLIINVTDLRNEKIFVCPGMRINVI